MARAIDPIDRVELRDTIGDWIEAHADVDDGEGIGLLEDVLWEINAQPTLTTPNEWVSVKERLPENNCRVLVHVTGKPFDIDADRLADGKWVRWGWCVTHWMPLPEPSKEYNHAV